MRWFFKSDFQFMPLVFLYKNYVLRHKKYMIMALSFMILTSLSTAGSIYLIKPVINKIFILKKNSYLNLLCIILLIVAVVKFISSSMQDLMIYIVQEKIAMSLRDDLFRHFIRLNMNSIHNINQGNFISVFTNDIMVIHLNIYDIFVTGIGEMILLIFLTIVIIIQDSYLAFVALIIFPVILIPLKKITKSLRKKYTASQLVYDIIISKLTDILTGIKTIKAYAGENSEIRYFKTILFDMFRKSISFKRKACIASPMMEFFGTVSITFIIFYSGHRVIANTYDIGKLMTFIASVIAAYKPAKNLSNLYSRMQVANVSMQRIINILQTGVVERIKYGLTPDISNPIIEFKNVSFCYNSSDNRNNIAVNNVNLTIKPRTKIAFVGESGSGKSTIVNMLLRLYEPTSGSIFINNYDIRDINLSYLRENIAYIGQDGFLFDDTILNNITYNMKKSLLGEESIINRISNVIKMSEINFINDKQIYSERIDIGKNGSKLSTGQKQRIGIARGIMKNNDILIVDEGTSALDLTTENKIKDTLFKEMSDKTIIFIAHRLQTIVDCDTIYVVDNGFIVESGSHSELLTKRGYYYQLWYNIDKNN